MMEDRTFGFRIKEREREVKHYPKEYERGTIGWCHEMVYVYERRCKELEKENAKLKEEILRLKNK